MDASRSRDLVDDDPSEPATAPVQRDISYSADGLRDDAHAVVIGINKYADSRIDDLQFARADADAVYAALVDPAVGQFKRQNVTLLVDEEATMAGIKSAIGTGLRNATQPDDTVIVYFAGHGAPEIDGREGEPRNADGLQKYLVPHDARRDDLYASAIPMDEIQKMFGRIKARRLVFFLDACYSGNAGGRSFASQDVNTRAAIMTGDFLEELAGEGRCVITSCDVGEVSVESPDFGGGHGVFTHYLVKGLRGEADENGNGVVDVGELYDYVCRQVRAEHRRRTMKMQPVKKGELRGRVLLSSYVVPPEKRARRLRSEAAAAEQRGDLAEAARLWREAKALDPADSTAPASLAAVEARLAERHREREAAESRLCAYYESGVLPAGPYDQALDLLHREDGSLSEGERKIRRVLDDLLAGKIAPANYVRTVERLSRASDAAIPVPAPASPVAASVASPTTPPVAAATAPTTAPATAPTTAPVATSVAAPRRAALPAVIAGGVAVVALAATGLFLTTRGDATPPPPDTTQPVVNPPAKPDTIPPDPDPVPKPVVIAQRRPDPDPVPAPVTPPPRPSDPMADSVQRLVAAANANDAAAMNALAALYESGTSGLQSDSAAAYWYRTAAGRGSVDGVRRLAALYRSGRGATPVDVPSERVRLSPVGCDADTNSKYRLVCTIQVIDRAERKHEMTVNAVFLADATGMILKDTDGNPTEAETAIYDREGEKEGKIRGSVDDLKRTIYPNATVPLIVNFNRVPAAYRGRLFTLLVKTGGGSAKDTRIPNVPVP